MKFVALSLSMLLLAATAVADLTPGTVVSAGAPFPIVADFDGDGLDDLIQERNVLLSNGDGPAEELSLGLPAYERAIGALDVNADGIFDLVTEKPGPVAPIFVVPQPTPAASGYRLRIGDAHRRYDKAINISSGLRPYVADADGDGRDDLVLMVDVRPDGRVSTATDVTVLRSLGNGEFVQLPAVRISANVQLSDHRVPSADLNHDGLTDLVLRTTQELVVLRGTGGGNFVAEARYMPWEFGSWGLRLADIDGDSHPDIVSAGQRRVRVLFGDGTGRFPRGGTALIAQHRQGDYAPGVTVPERAMQPRNIAVGHFTRADRNEIATGTMEGDLVVYAYEHGVLKEVSRTRTEFWLLDVRTGAFRKDGSLDDLYVGGTLIWGDVWPRPRLFYRESERAAAPQRAASRRRSAPEAASTKGGLELRVSGDCFETTAGRWALAREGVFGAARNGGIAIDTLADDSSLYFRLSAPHLTEPIVGVLTEAAGAYSGTVEAQTACGPKSIRVTARIE